MFYVFLVLAGYQKYNVAAKKLDRRLAALGGQALLACGLGDDQHPWGYDAGLDAWLPLLWPALSRIFPLPADATEACSRFICSTVCVNPKP